MYLFNRTKNCSVKQVGDDLFARTVLVDTVHEMVLEMSAGLHDLNIKSVKMYMMRTPHDMCKDVEKKAQDLVGCSVKPGIAKIVKEKIGGCEGCYHFTDIFLDTIKALKQGRYHWVYDNKSKQEREKYYWNDLKGTCYYYSNGRKQLARNHEN